MGRHRYARLLSKNFIYVISCLALLLLGYEISYEFSGVRAISLAPLQPRSFSLDLRVVLYPIPFSFNISYPKTKKGKQNYYFLCLITMNGSLFSFLISRGTHSRTR